MAPSPCSGWRGHRVSSIHAATPNTTRKEIRVVRGQRPPPPPPSVPPRPRPFRQRRERGGAGARQAVALTAQRSNSGASSTQKPLQQRPSVLPHRVFEPPRGVAAPDPLLADLDTGARRSRA